MNSTKNNNCTDLSIPDITPGEEVIYGVMNLDGNGSNLPTFICQGAYTVDWGDGVVNNYQGNDTANHEYSYSAGDNTRVIFKVTPQAGQQLTYIDFSGYDSGSSTEDDSEYNYLGIVVNAPNADVIMVGDYGSTNTRRLVSFSSPENKVTDMSHMFEGCSRLQSIPQLDTSHATKMASMFYSCNALHSIPMMDTSRVTNMENMFGFCLSLKSVPMLDTSKVTNMEGMFQTCAIKSIPMFNTHQVTNMYSMFQGSAIETIPLLDTSKVTNMYNMFSSCTHLQSVPLLDTSIVTNMSGMFYYCSSLQTITLLDTSKVTKMKQTFLSCTSLSKLTLNNVKVSFDISIKKLSAEALNSLFAGLATVSDETINISGNPGAATCDRSIATNKGWTIIG